jgi:uncharacterized protein
MSPAPPPATPGVVIRDAHYPGRAPIDAYGNGGFRFAGMSHRGGIISVPSGIYAWPVTRDDEIDAAALERVFAEAEAIDILLIGTGREMRPVNRDLRERLRGANIIADTMSTGAAVRTFNVILAEQRAVAVALVPVD